MLDGPIGAARDFLNRAFIKNSGAGPRAYDAPSPYEKMAYTAGDMYYIGNIGITTTSIGKTRAGAQLSNWGFSTPLS